MPVIASACLCGIICRWHGRKVNKVKVIRDLEASGVQVIPVCPEVLAGLPVPRPPVKTRKGRVYETDETRTTVGRELTAEFTRGATAALRIAQDAEAIRAYFFMYSPSCSPGGITGKLFRAAGIEVRAIR